VAVGYGLLALKPTDVIVLNDVPVTPSAVKACIGAGTGLGECFLTFNGKQYDAWPAEGGHVDFAPRDELEFALLKHIREAERVERVSVERVVSGKGIPGVYDFFKKLYPDELNADVEQKLLREEQKADVISKAAEAGTCSLSRRALDMFVGCYGAEAGNLALKTLPFGGLYIAGGIAPKIMWAMRRNHQFWNNFIAKGRMGSLLEKIPVYVVVHKDVGLLGAKVLCQRQLREKGEKNFAARSLRSKL